MGHNKLHLDSRGTRPRSARGADPPPGPRLWVTLYASVFAWRSVLFFCSLVGVWFLGFAVTDGGGEGFDDPDDFGVVGTILVVVIYFVWLFVMGTLLVTAAALALAHVLISIPAVASTQQSFLTAFAAVAALLPFTIAPFAYRPGATLILCIVFGMGNCAIAFRVARLLPQFPAPEFRRP